MLNVLTDIKTIIKTIGSVILALLIIFLPLIIAIIKDVRKPRRKPKRWQVATSVYVNITLAIITLYFMREEQLKKYWGIPAILVVIAVTATCIIFEKIRQKANKEEREERNGSYIIIENTTIKQQTYAPEYKTYTKKNFQTECEKEFYKKLIQATENLKVIVRPQIPLSSVINKTYGRYQNELYRIIDYGIFDTEENLLLLIELNDKTHFQDYRHERDLKVNSICKKAGINIIYFWTDEPNNVDYITRRIETYIKTNVQAV